MYQVLSQSVHVLYSPFPVQKAAHSGGLGAGVTQMAEYFWDALQLYGHYVPHFFDLQNADVDSVLNPNSPAPAPEPQSRLRSGRCKATWNDRKVDVRLPGEGILNSLGARPVHLIKWIRTDRLSKKNSLSLRREI